MVYIIALFCLEADAPPAYLRAKPVIEAPACFEHREEYADGLQICFTRGVLVHTPRLRKLYGRPFVFAGSYCKEIKRP